MALRIRGRHWHYRFIISGRTWTGDTGLAATERNRNAALMKEAEARRAVLEGRGSQLKIQVKSFGDAADQFVEWAKGEHAKKPNTWKRLRGSLTSLKEFFGNVPIHSITVGQIQDYMAWRRKMEIKDVTLRHDLHALAPLFRYAKNHNWSMLNPVDEVRVPSDRDAQRIHVVSPAEEMKYFAACEEFERENLAKAAKTNRSGAWKRAARDYRALHDIAKIMLLQGARPMEVMSTANSAINLEAGTWKIQDSKSHAGKRVLKLLPESLSILANRNDGAWAFPGKKPGAHLVDIQHSHEAVLEKANLDFVLYDFRHTFATRMSERGMDVATLAAILGHANLRTVMRYVHLSKEHIHAATLRFGIVEQSEETEQLPETAKGSVQ